VTHWSSRLLASHLGDVSHATVARLWQLWQLQHWRAETFKFSTDPELVAKVTDIVGLYLHPPDNAIVLCVDEKSQIQALEHIQPILPLKPGAVTRLPPARHHHPVRRAGGRHRQVTDACYPRHRGVEFPQSSSSSSPRPTRAGSYTSWSTTTPPTTTPNAKAWLAKHPRIHLHFTPQTHSSWMNLVESFFSIITRQAIRRASFTSVRQVTDAIRTFIGAWNDRCAPFIWTKTADPTTSSPSPAAKPTPQRTTRP
jgi:hypothetical protein